jgi:hypothetical protein
MTYRTTGNAAVATHLTVPNLLQFIDLEIDKITETEALTALNDTLKQKLQTRIKSLLEEFYKEQGSHMESSKLFNRIILQFRRLLQKLYPSPTVLKRVGCKYKV